MEQLITSKEEMDICAQAVLARLSVEKQKSQDNGATVLGLSGELGAGKTTFVQALARALGVIESVTSPTFVIARFYPLTSNSQFNKLVHIDAYRIEDETELAPIGWSDILSDNKNLVIVEWPEKLGTALPKNAGIIEFSVINDFTRKIFDKKNI